MSVEGQYEAMVHQWTDVVNHLPRMVDLVVNLGAQHVLELGTRDGVSTRAWLMGLSVTGGRLTTVDLLPAPPLESGQVPWTHIVGSDMDPDVVERLREAGPYSVVFIDTSHEFQHTMDEIATYWPMVAEGGCMCFHDLYLDETGGTKPGPVLQAITDTLLKDHAMVSYDDSHGFGIVKR